MRATLMRLLTLAGGTAMAAACGGGGDSRQSSEPAPSPAAQAAAAPRPAAFAVCVSCHTTEPGRGPGVGPNLFGVVGSKAGSRPGYNYSDALKGSGIVWTEETIARFIADPQGMVPGTRMMIRGPKDPEQQRAITSYLASLK